MKKRLKILIPLVLLGGLGVMYLLHIRNGESGDTISVSGNIEVTESRLGFKIPGKLERRLVDEGDSIKKGQALAVLDNRDQLVALARAQAAYDYSRSLVAELTAGSRPEEVDRALARVNQAQYALDELKNGSRTQDVERARAEMERAEAASKAADVKLEQAKLDLKRFEALYKDEGVSQWKYEQYKTNYETAKNLSLEAAARVTNAREALSLSKEGPREEAIKQAGAALEQAQAEYNLVKTGPRQETIDQATARMNEAKAALDQAKLQLEYTELKAPMDGVVLTQAAEAGEVLNPGAVVLVMGDLAHPWVRAYIREQDLGRVRVGDPVQVTTDAFENRVFPGKISFISSQAEFTPKSVQTFEERVKLMFRIKIDLENPEGCLRPGMPADGLISGFQNGPKPQTDKS